MNDKTLLKKDVEARERKGFPEYIFSEDVNIFFEDRVDSSFLKELRPWLYWSYYRNREVWGELYLTNISEVREGRIITTRYYVLNLNAIYELPLILYEQNLIEI